MSAPTAAAATPTGGANIPLMNREMLPGYMEDLQREIGEITRSLAAKRALLLQCAEMSMVVGLRLTAVAPYRPGTETPPTLAGADGEPIRGAAR